ncbi:TIGR02234 family membrane protein [Gordonia phthalatica]|nr:TIGR02234 family membrane protein [Gordonia phthalatica]
MSESESVDPVESTSTTGAPTSMNRRYQAIASILILVAALGLWGASRMKWATILVGENPPSPSRVVTVDGSQWSPWLVAVAIAMVAAVGAQFAVRGMALRLVAILVAIGGGVSVIPAISLLTEGQDNSYIVKMAGLDPSRNPIDGIPVESTPGYLVIAAAVCAVIGAVFMMRTANKSGMSSKYDSPAARRAELERKVFAERERAAAGEPVAPETNERFLWDSLDEGLDPTDDEK